MSTTSNPDVFYYDENSFKDHVKLLMGSRNGDLIIDVLIMLGDDEGVLGGFYDLLVCYNTALYEISEFYPSPGDEWYTRISALVNIPVIAFMNGYNVPFMFSKESGLLNCDFRDFMFDNTLHTDEHIRRVEDLVGRFLESFFMPFSKRFYQEGINIYEFLIETYSDEYGIYEIEFCAEKYE